MAKVTSGMLKIKCSGNSKDQCQHMRNKAFRVTKKDLIDLYIVKDKKANGGYCMVANLVGTSSQFKKLSNVFKNTTVTSSGKLIEIEDVQTIEGI